VLFVKWFFEKKIKKFFCKKLEKAAGKLEKFGKNKK